MQEILFPSSVGINGQVLGALAIENHLSLDESGHENERKKMRF